MGDIWTRMGVTPDKRSWHSERIDVVARQNIALREWAPKVWSVICALLGGEERIEGWCDTWEDSFIVNLGTPEAEGKIIHGKDLQGWHIDGDDFSHFLDSKEMGLLILPLFTDVREHSGGTVLCPGALSEIARFLCSHPEGVSPDLVPRAEDPNWNRTPTRWRVGEIIERMPRNAFLEATGNAGDVYFIHPLMPHSASNNSTRELRVINNPSARLKGAFNFDRPDGNYSVVELTTLHHLDRDSLRGWRATGSRDKIVPERELQEDLKRLQQTKPKFVGGLHVTNP